jgi:hypothetical protein
MTVPTSDFERTPETARGQAMHQLLLAVHAHIRRDLETVHRLTADIRDGLDAGETQRQLHELKRGGMLWQLQVGCLRYCSFVHLQHRPPPALSAVPLWCGGPRARTRRRSWAKSSNNWST